MPKLHRRIWLRFPCRRETFCQCAKRDDVSCSAYVQNVSRGGLGLLCPQQFEPGTIIKIRTPARDQELAFLSARVVYANSTSDGRWAMGCAFCKELSEDELGAWLKRQDGVGATRQALPEPVMGPVVSDSVPQVEKAERKGSLSSLGVKKTITPIPSTGERSGDVGFEPIEEVASFRGHRGRISTIAFTSDRRMVASGGQDGGIRLWSFDKSPEQPIPYVHPGGVQVLALASDGKKLASAAGKPEGLVRLWDLSSTRPKFISHLHVPKAPVASVAFSSDGNVLAIACDKTILLWDLTKPGLREECELRGHAQGVTSLAFAPNRLTMASGSQDGTVRLWTTEFGRATELAVLNGSNSDVLSLAFSPDGRTVAFGNQDHTVNVWRITENIPREQALLQGHGDPVRLVLFPTDGQTLLSVDSRNCVFLWDLASATRIRQWLLPGGTIVASVACTPDGRYVATGTMGIMTLFRLYPKNKTSQTESRLFARASISPPAPSANTRDRDDDPTAG